MTVLRNLPPRRQSLRAKAVFVDPTDGAEFKLYVTVGIDPADGRIAEIFVRTGGKAGKNSLLHRVLDAEAVLISKLLERGMTLEEIARTLGSEVPIAKAVHIAIDLQKDIDGWPPGVALATPINTALTQP